MKLFKIDANVDYVMGYLRYGHYEGTIAVPDDRVNDEEYIKGLIRSTCDFVVDDYSIEDIGEITELVEMKEIGVAGE